MFGDTGNPADFKWGFLIGCIGMLLSVIVQLLFHHNYVKDPEGKTLGLTPENSPAIATKPITIIVGLLLFSFITIGLIYIDAKLNTSSKRILLYLTHHNILGKHLIVSVLQNYIFYLLIACIVFIGVVIFSDKTLNPIEKSKVAVIFIVSFFVIFFWSAYEQAGASLTFFADEQTNRDLGFYVVPASWFQSINSVFIVTLAPIFAWFWLKLGKSEPSSPTKMALGLFLLAVGYLWIAFGVKNVQPGIKVSMIWLVCTSCIPPVNYVYRPLDYH